MSQDFAPEAVVRWTINLILAGTEPRFLDSRFNEPSKIDGTVMYLSTREGARLLESGWFCPTTVGSGSHRLTAEGIRYGLDLVGHPTFDVRPLIEAVLSMALFCPAPEIDGRTAIPAIYTPGSSKLVLVLGENASGKSLFRRAASLAVHQGRVSSYEGRAIPRGAFPMSEFIGLSMQGRSGQYSSMIYGDESRSSTGENSARAVTMGIQTATNRRLTHALYWDEPDIGMTAGLAAGAGMAIRAFIQTDTPLTQAVFVTTHSEALVRVLMECDPHYIYLGDAEGPRTLEQWLAQQSNPTPILPDEIQGRARARYRDIQLVLNGFGK